MSRVLVVYASHFGQTCAIATRIAQRLREDGHDVELADARVGTRNLPPPEDYDAVVLGSRVELGRHSSFVVDYIRAHRTALLGVPTAFFSVSMAAARRGAGNDPSGYLMNLFGELDWYPSESAAFAGALPYRRYGWVLRAIMKRIARGGGHTTDTAHDHVFTDFAAVVKFADRVADLVFDRDADAAVAHF